MRRLALALILAAGCGGRMRPMRMMSLNIANGADGGYWTTAEARARQRALVAGEAVDLLAMQEVDRGAARSGGADTAAEVVGDVPGDMVFSKAIDLQGGEYGVAAWVSARLEVRGIWRATLPTDGTGTWVALFTSVADGYGEVVVATTHLANGDRADLRRAQLAAVLLRGPDVVLGDLNGTEAELSSSAPGYAWATPGASIDAAVCRVACAGALVPTAGASDHANAALVEVMP